MLVCGLPIVVGGDSNTELKWEAEEEREAQVFSSKSKGEYMLGASMEKGITFTAPPRGQWTTPTIRPGNQEATGRQIDCVASKRVRSTSARILEGSYMLVGRIMTQFYRRLKLRIQGRRDIEDPEQHRGELPRQWKSQRR